MRVTFLVLSVLFSLIFVIFCVFRIVNDIVFDRNCEGYLKRVADANTIELAQNNLATALRYVEDNNLTSDYTSVVYRTPDEDVGFWHDNLKASLQELRSIKSDASQLEKSNVLLKLRETLLDHGQSLSVTAPSGISVFPNNFSYALWGLLSFLFAAISWFFVAVIDDTKTKSIWTYTTRVI